MEANPNWLIFLLYSKISIGEFQISKTGGFDSARNVKILANLDSVHFNAFFISDEFMFASLAGHTQLHIGGDRPSNFNRGIEDGKTMITLSLPTWKEMIVISNRSFSISTSAITS